MMIQSVFALIATTIYLQFLNQLYKVNESYPFLGVSIVDLVVTVVIIILFATGLMNQPGVKVKHELQRT